MSLEPRFFDTPLQAAHVWLIALMADDAIDPDGPMQQSRRHAADGLMVRKAHDAAPCSVLLRSADAIGPAQLGPGQ